ncbi:hypothetical protein CPB85DRAFT_798494 [Mucidula mucida]|nr:hypothetical protein CPB85DRAFT_798494 [Mucidula mucida]
MDSLVSSFVLLVAMRPAPSTIVSFFDLFQIKDIQHEHWSYRSHQIIKRRQYLSISVTHDDDLFFHWAPVVANLHKTDGRLTNTLKLECRYPEARITFAIMEHESIAGLQRSEPKVLSIRSLSADELSTLDGKIKLFSPGTSNGVPAATLDVTLSVARRAEFKNGPGSNGASSLIQSVEPGRMLCTFGKKQVWIPTTSLDKQYWVQHDTPEATYRVISADVDLGSSGVRSCPGLNLI